MKHVSTSRRSGEFSKLLESPSAQALLMTLQPGDASEERPANEHPRCEQWLYVVSGSGTAITVTDDSRRSRKLAPGSLLLIEKRERHQIKNTGSQPLRTINLYVPPAYGPGGDPLPSATAKRSGKR
jgi:mannose-6-phosphate isomerase-like protein (cupin superfamily)